MTPDLALSEIESEFSSLLGAPSKNTLTLKKLAGDISTRRYYRVTTHANAFILQQADVFSDPQQNTFLVAQQLLESCGVRVPKIIEVRPKKGWILMEDLGDEMLQTHISQKLYFEAIDALACWTQRAHTLNPLLKHKDAPHFKQYFDIEKLSFEMNHTDVHLFQKLLKAPAKTFFNLTQKNTAYLNDRPRFFCHRDYHSRNIMVRNSHTHIIDFQDARMGPITYDLVSLVFDPYAQLPESLQKTVTEYWKSQVSSAAAPTAVAEQIKKALLDFDQEMHRMKIQRLLKAAGSYASFYNTRGRNDYLNCIPYAVKECLSSLAWLEQFSKASSEDRALTALLKSQTFTQLEIA